MHVDKILCIIIITLAPVLAAGDLVCPALLAFLPAVAAFRAAFFVLFFAGAALPLPVD